MHSDPLLFTIFIIFAGAAVLATAALYAHQALLLAYIILGILFGPWGMGLVTDPELIKDIAHIGIIFLLFLLGLNLHPQKLWSLLREATYVTLISSFAFAAAAIVPLWLFGFNWTECVVIAAALMFSSTIIALKLLPTTVLHHQRTGEIIISIVLLQDIIAILVLLMLRLMGPDEIPHLELGLLVVSLPVLVVFAYLFERYVLFKVIRRFDKFQEYIFLVAIGWCLGVGQLAATFGLSPEVGAFIAGVALARSPISFFIAENLKPLRDFFLIIFFFSLGASFNLDTVMGILVPASLLAAMTLFLKPLVFMYLLGRSGESPARATEIGVRLGQMSEFSLLIAVLAGQRGIIGPDASYLIQTSTLLTFIVSPYIVVLSYPSPIAISDRLRGD